MLKDLIEHIKASMSIFGRSDTDLYGLLAEFRDPGELVHAAEGVHGAGYRRFDVHSPFPIHGMDKAMGLGNSKVGVFSLGGGLAGVATGYWLQWWTGAVDYPLNISGKPAFAVEPSIPVMFEITILFAALGAVAYLLLMFFQQIKETDLLAMSGVVNIIIIKPSTVVTSQNHCFFYSPVRQFA